MSIETLKQDLKQIGDALKEQPDPIDYLRNNLVPFLESVISEISEIDESVEDVIHQSVDILHAESGAVFAGIIEGAQVLVNELKAVAASNQRVQGLIKDWNELADQGRAILDEVVIGDDEDDDEDSDDDDDETDGGK